MKKSFYAKWLIIVVLLMIFSAGCADGDALTGDDHEDTLTLPTVAVTPTPRPTQVVETKQPINVSAQAYVSPSGIFQINLPEGWNCSESGQFQVNCESPSSDARLQARITSTGYELTDEDFANFIHAELVNRYGAVKEYIEIEQVPLPDQVIRRATWREDTDYWESVDAFRRDGRGVFHLTIANKQTQSDIFAGLYGAVADSVLIQPENISRDALYPFRKIVQARNGLFEIEIPTSWIRFIDTSSVEKTIVEGYISPDKKASVQIATYTQGTFIEQEAKAFNTREIMFELYGYDLKNSADRALPDGRERLTWYAAQKDINGVTDFDTYVNTLFLFTVTWEPTTEALYLPVLEEIQDSFTRK